MSAASAVASPPLSFQVVSAENHGAAAAEVFAALPSDKMPTTIVALIISYLPSTVLHPDSTLSSARLQLPQGVVLFVRQQGHEAIYSVAGEDNQLSLLIVDMANKCAMRQLRIGPIPPNINAPGIQYGRHAMAKKGDNTFYAGSLDNLVHVWTVNEGTLQYQRNIALVAPARLADMNWIDFDPARNALLVSTSESVFVLNATSETVVHTLPGNYSETVCWPQDPNVPGMEYAMLKDGVELWNPSPSPAAATAAAAVTEPVTRKIPVVKPVLDRFSQHSVRTCLGSTLVMTTRSELVFIDLTGQNMKPRELPLPPRESVQALTSSAAGLWTLTNNPPPQTSLFSRVVCSRQPALSHAPQVLRLYHPDDRLIVLAELHPSLKLSAIVGYGDTLLCMEKPPSKERLDDYDGPVSCLYYVKVEKPAQALSSAAPATTTTAAAGIDTKRDF
jgi:hypothetical protein